MDAKTSEWRPGPTVCRCCLTEGCYKDISTEYFWMGKREVYSEMLSETFSVSISYSKSGGPNSHSRLICEQCISRLRDAADFRRQVVECEKMFMQHLDPGTSSIDFPVVATELPEKEVKLERVKLEKVPSDDEFDDRGFPDDDDDDDDMDDEPLMKLATKIPKKESVDIHDLLDNTKLVLKRKATTTKKPVVPAKKLKNKKEVKATPSKAPAKPAPKPVEKKKKEKRSDLYSIARRNAELILKNATVHPFKLPEEKMVCVYCCEGYEDPAMFRQHMNDEHPTFTIRMAFIHCSEGYVKADCSDIRCRLCSLQLENLEETAKHLHYKHKIPINLNVEVGMQPFKLVEDKLHCAICDTKSLCMRQLSRHTQSHFLKFTCESCGKSYSTMTSLRAHMRFSHIKDERICRKCKTTFSNLDALRKHTAESKRCWAYLCTVCGERFMTWTLKQSHMVEAHGTEKKNYVCPECSEVFFSRHKFRFHFKIKHTDDNYTCPGCGIKFDTKKNLEEHRVKHTKERLFPCTVCPKSFARKKNLVQHMWIHSEYKRYECKLCNKQFNQRVSWRTHMKSYHPEIRSGVIITGNAKLLVRYATVYPFKLPNNAMHCVFCESSYENPAIFRQHVKNVHKSFKVNDAFYHVGIEYLLKVDCTELECRICAQKAESLDDMAVHLKMHSQCRSLDLNYELGLQPYILDNASRFSCTFCDTSVMTIRALSRHMQSHYKRFTCETCGNSYASTASLHSHTISAHVSEQKYLCRKCRTYFSTLEERRKHVEETPKCWPYICRICSERLISVTHRRHHYATVHGYSTSFKCPECPEEFITVRQRRSHCVKNHKDKAIFCIHCDESFMDKSSYDEHMESHLIKPIECRVCSKEFSSKEQLKQHIWVHSKIKRFECKLCEKQFISKANWKVHMQYHHPDEPCTEEFLKIRDTKFIEEILQLNQ